MITHKNIRLFTFLVSAVFTAALFSCDREYEPVFNESPDERVRQSLAAYTSMLTEAEFGWKATLYTASGATFLYYFDFSDDGTVAMAADFNETTAGDVMSGTWVLKALQRPTLSFDTYSYIHLPADPDGDVNGGEDGEGLESDFEFAFEKTSGDTVFLQGIQKGSSITFLKATEGDAAVFTGGALRDMLHYISTEEGLRLTLPDDKIVTVAFHPDARIMGAQYLTEDEQGVESFSSAFEFTTQGIALKSPLQVEGYTIDEFLWDADKGTYTVQLGSASEDIVSVDGLYIFEPSTPLYSVIGSTYTLIQVPQNSGVDPLPGQSDEYIIKYNQAVDNLINGQFALTLNEINYSFDQSTQTLLVDMWVTQNGTRFLAEYNYGYSIDENGVLSFFFNDANENGWAVRSDADPLLEFMETNTFRVEYVGGGFSLIAGIFSQENSEFYFSGYLGE